MNLGCSVKNADPVTLTLTSCPDDIDCKQRREFELYECLLVTHADYVCLFVCLFVRRITQKRMIQKCYCFGVQRSNVKVTASVSSFCTLEPRFIDIR